MTLPNIPVQSTDRTSLSTNPLTSQVIYRGSVSISVSTAITMGYQGTASVDLRSLIDTPVMNPVIFVYEYELFAAASHTLTPVPYSYYSAAGALSRCATWQLYNLADGTMNLNFVVKSTSSINVVMYYVVYSTRVQDGYIFNP